MALFAGFLKKIAAFLLPTLLDWALEKIATLRKQKERSDKTKAEIEEEARRAREQTEKAQTKDERDAAAKNVIDRF